MDFSVMIPLIMLMFVITLIMAMMSMVGLSPSMLLWLFTAARRQRTEMEPRDHYDRWDHSHRRSAAENKPQRLKWLCTTGDRMVPMKTIGRVRGAEPWLNFNLVYLKTRRFAWSAPYLIPNDMCSDLNRRVLWIRARGFSNVGTIRFPIPIEGDTYRKAFKIRGKISHRILPRTVNSIVEEVQDGFRFSMEQQLHMDITEDMHWDIGSGMAPPIREKVRVTEADSPGFGEKEYMPEESATGGRVI